MSEAPTKVEEADIVVEVELEAPPAKVWRAICEPEIRSDWLGEAEAGASEVRRAEPPERLDLAWPTREGESLISFEITPGENGGSRLTIIHRAPQMAAVLPFKLRTRPIPSVAGWRIAA